MSWLEHFPKFNKRGVCNKNVLGGKFSEKLISEGEGASIGDLRVLHYEMQKAFYLGCAFNGPSNHFFFSRFKIFTLI